MTPSTQAIFLSYGSQDARAAQAICDALRAAGLEVWFDRSELRGGDAWDASIREQILSCALFIPLITENTDARAEGYFRLEWKLAVDRSHLLADDQPFLLPVALGAVRESSARVPADFRVRQWLRLSDPSAASVLVARVRQLLGAESHPGPAAAPRAVAAPPAEAEKGFWIAVLPFGHRGADPDAETLAAGLTEETVTGLSRFSYLRVVARGATTPGAGGSPDVRAIGQDLGARYLVQGSVRQAGGQVRVSGQLVDAITGAHLWAENYDRAFTPETLFDLQDDVAQRIVATVADMNGVLVRSMSDRLRERDPATLTPYEVVLRSFGYLARLDAAEHALVRDALEHCAPNLDADGWAMLAHAYGEEYKHGFDARPGSLDRALDAARRAVAAGPANALCYHMLAQTLFFRREFPAFRNAATRAVALNPMDACTAAFMGILLAYAGEWELGCELADRAMELNPHHPGWYRFAEYTDALRRRDFEAALEAALKFNMPSYFYTHFAVAAACGHLGDQEAAGRAVSELLAHKPGFAAVAREELGKWYVDEELLYLAMEGLRKAGLPVAL